MRRLGSSDVLAIWEENRYRSSTHRALSILGRVLPDALADDLAGLPLGQRSSLLLEAHGRDVESTLDGVCDCPECGSLVSVTVAIFELLQQAECARHETDVDVDGQKFRCRPPNSDDLLAIAKLQTARDARDALLTRCVKPLSDGVTIGDCGETAIAKLEQHIADCDPLAEIVLDTTCPDCNTEWQVDLDVVEFVWNALDEQAQQLLLTIDVLARAYGWSEPEILALSPARRAWYLDRVC